MYVLLLTPFLYFSSQVLCFHTKSIFSLPFHSLEVDFSIIFHCVKKWFLFVRCIFSCLLISLTISRTNLTLETFYGHNFSLNLSLREDYQCWSSIQILLTQRWNQNFRFMQILVMQFIFSLLMQQTQSINLAMQFLLGLLIIDILSI